MQGRNNGAGRINKTKDSDNRKETGDRKLIYSVSSFSDFLPKMKNLVGPVGLEPTANRL